jgi:hypothetical protein
VKVNKEVKVYIHLMAILTSQPGFAISTTTSESSANTAAPEVLAPSNVPQIKATQTQNASGGIITGRVRESDEDLTNLITRQAVEAEAVNAGRLQNTQPGPATSPRESVVLVVKNTQVSPQREYDITRALQKLQRTCNHRFDRSSNRCIYCSKHKNSHVCDIGKI